MARSFSEYMPDGHELLQKLGNRNTLRALSGVLLVTMLISFAIWAISDSNADEKLAIGNRENLTLVELRSFESIPRRPIEHQFFGIVQARRSVNLSSKLSERLLSLAVAVGDSVEAGQPLIELEKKDHLAALAVAQAELAGAQAKLQELQRGPRVEEIASAEAAVEERRAIALMHQQTFERMTAAAQSGAVASAELDDANYGLQASQAQFRQALEHLTALQVGTRNEQLVGQQALVDAHLARVTQLETRLSECTLRAPFSGCIQHRWVDEGELVAPMQPILTLVESQVMEVHVGLPPSVAVNAFANNAQNTTVEIKIGNKEVAVSLSSLAPALDPVTGTRQAVFKLTSMDNFSFASGESAQVVLRSRTEIGHWVPLSALTSIAHGMWGLWIALPTIERGVYKLEHRPIEVLSQQSDWIQVQGDMLARDLFVPVGTSRLSPGQYVIFEGQSSR